MTRSEFLVSLAGLALAGCTSSKTSPSPPGPDAGSGTPPHDGAVTPPDAPNTPPANCLQNGTVSTIGANHGHVLVVSKDDVAAGADRTYHIMGTALHDHTVTITAAMFATLAANSGVMTVSSTDSAHSHTIAVVCA